MPLDVLGYVVAQPLQIVLESREGLVVLASVGSQLLARRDVAGATIGADGEVTCHLPRREALLWVVVDASALLPLRLGDGVAKELDELLGLG